MKTVSHLIWFSESENKLLLKRSQNFPSVTRAVIVAIKDACRYQRLIDQAKKLEQTANVKPIALKVTLK